MNGKGDTYRPYNQAAYGEGYDRIFRRGLEQNLDKLQETHDQAPVKQAANDQACPVCGYYADDFEHTELCPAGPGKAGQHDAAEAPVSEQAPASGSPAGEDVQRERAER